MFAARAWLTASSPESCSLAVGRLWKSAAIERSSGEKVFPGRKSRDEITARAHTSYCGMPDGKYATHVGTVGIRNACGDCGHTQRMWGLLAYATHVGAVDIRNACGGCGHTQRMWGLWGIRNRLWHYDVCVGWAGDLLSFISGKTFGDGRKTNLAMDIL